MTQQLQTDMSQHLRNTWGLQWKIHPIFHVFVERQEELNFEPTWVFAAKMNLSKDRVMLYAGYNSSQAMTAAGIECRFKSFGLTLAYNTHAILGSSHALSMHWMP
jgi:hypothetical protein